MGKSVFGAFWGFGQKALRRGTRVFRAESYCAAYAHIKHVCLTETAARRFLQEFRTMHETSPPVTHFRASAKRGRPYRKPV